jgi:hypothetical protein
VRGFAEARQTRSGRVVLAMLGITAGLQVMAGYILVVQR